MAQEMGWHRLSLQRLREQYQTELSVGVPQEAAYLQRYVDESKKWRDDHHMIEVPYGPSPAETLRIFRVQGDTPRPTVINLKGGYWRIPGAEWVDFVAAGMNPLGVNVVNVDYGTMPDTSMGDIIGQVSNALRWVFNNGQEYGLDTGNVHLVGHSAGGHLAAIMHAQQIDGIPVDGIKSTTCVSGVYDIGFASYGHLNEGDRAIHLDPMDAIRFSPINMVPMRKQPITFIVGEKETDEFHKQAETMHQTWKNLGGNTNVIEASGEDHFSLYFGLHDPNSTISQQVYHSISSSKSST